MRDSSRAEPSRVERGTCARGGGESSGCGSSSSSQSPFDGICKGMRRHTEPACDCRNTKDREREEKRREKRRDGTGLITTMTTTANAPPTFRRQRRRRSGTRLHQTQTRTVQLYSLKLPYPTALLSHTTTFLLLPFGFHQFVRPRRVIYTFV